jgi:hypothetical protein
VATLRPPALALAALLTASVVASAQGTKLDIAGHLKYRFLGTSLPEDSLLRTLSDDPTLDHALELRLNLDLDHGPWRFDVNYQLLGLAGDTIDFTRDLPAALEPFYPRYPRDEARLLDLTHVIRDEGHSAIVQRFDRLSLGYSGAKLVVRAGRQALSWGNGLVYSPMDILNPFDPAAVDKEYKTGDDMLYAQYLGDEGDDLQAVTVLRSDPATGSLAARACSFAFKYHALAGRGEVDVLAARHFGDHLIGLGGNRGIGGAVWRGDLVVTLTERRTVVTGVTSLSYSWTWVGRNVNALVEYFWNGFGQPGGDYDPESLAQNRELTTRIARGELFTLARHYLAASAVVEIHPLVHLTPSVFANLSDGSALIQLAGKGDLRENLVLLGAVNLPLGASGTEFGGIPSGVPGRPLATGPALFLQLAWYF